VASVTTAAALITAATGEAPHLQASAWVWHVGPTTPIPRLVSTTRFAECTAGRPTSGVLAVRAATSCILAPSS
jgi:hypothetical protein